MTFPEILNLNHMISEPAEPQDKSAELPECVNHVESADPADCEVVTEIKDDAGAAAGGCDNGHGDQGEEGL